MKRLTKESELEIGKYYYSEWDHKSGENGRLFSIIRLTKTRNDGSSILMYYDVGVFSGYSSRLLYNDHQHLSSTSNGITREATVEEIDYYSACIKAGKPIKYKAWLEATRPRTTEEAFLPELNYQIY